MKLSRATSEQKIKALAELDGWKWLDHPDVKEATKTFTLPDKWVMQPDGALNFPHNAPKYTTSYDAIIPLIHKVAISGTMIRFARSHNILDTPSELADALLVVCEKFEF